MKGVLKYIVVFLSLCISARAINSPEVRCVSVLPNGNVILTWSIPPDPLVEFQSYQIFSSNSLAGPYVNIGNSTIYNQNFFQTVGCNANAIPYYFYVQTKNNAGILSPAIDTVKTIYLVMTSTPNSGIASFLWNDFHFPLPAGEGTVYNIFRETSLVSWTQIATVPVHTTLANYTFSDTINICSDSINYRVELFDPSSPCTSVSNVRGMRFKDKNAPMPPRLDSVSVNSNGQAVMGISPSWSQDTKCFIVYEFINGTWVAIDTLCTNNLPVIYTNTNSAANNASEQYSVAAIDSCGNISAIALNPQSTIFVKSTYDVCSKTATLNWNAYVNMISGVNYYEVLCSVNGGPFTNLANDTNSTTYQHKNLQQGSMYCYLIRAHSIIKTLAGQDSATSTSNKFCFTPSVANVPAYVYLDNVSVLNPAEKMDVEWYIDKTVAVGGFNVFRADSSGAYSQIAFVSCNNQSNYAITDNTVNVNSHVYYYYVQVLDTCMNPVMKTDTSNSILLKAVATGNFQATLNWNNYGKWLGNVNSFNIYRSIDGVFSGGPITNVPAGTFTYIDDLSNLTTHTGQFTYYVEAVEGAGNPYGFTAKSESNYAEVYIQAALYVPNAFVPKGHNKIFIPVGDFLEKTDYKFSIYDRWGQKIFETTDETQGWDGGQSEEGLYAYMIEYKTSIGEYRQQSGTVMLIR